MVSSLIFMPVTFVGCAEDILFSVTKGETDCKVIAIDVNDPLASQLNGEFPDLYAGDLC